MTDAHKNEVRASEAPATGTSGSKVSAVAAQRAAAILDVLAGGRSTSEAAQALEISVNHYYLLERKALEGLAAACEPQAQGPKGPDLAQQLRLLQRQLEDCQRECLRQAALVRATQRATGLAAVSEPKSRTKAKRGPVRKKRKPTVRALRAAEVIRKKASSKQELSVQQEVTPEASAGVDATSLEPKERHDGNGR